MGTKIGFQLALYGYSAVWQDAQLFATRGKPTAFKVKPIGNSWPCSHATPKASVAAPAREFFGEHARQRTKIQ